MWRNKTQLIYEYMKCRSCLYMIKLPLNLSSFFKDQEEKRNILWRAIHVILFKLNQKSYNDIGNMVTYIWWYHNIKSPVCDLAFSLATKITRWIKHFVNNCICQIMQDETMEEFYDIAWKYPNTCIIVLGNLVLRLFIVSTCFLLNYFVC